MPGRPTVWTRKWWREREREAENEAALWKHTDTWPLPSHPERLSDWAIVSTSPSICTPAPSASPQHIVPPPCPSSCSLTLTHTNACQHFIWLVVGVTYVQFFGDFPLPVLHKTKVWGLGECVSVHMCVRVFVSVCAVKVRWWEKAKKWRIIILYIVFISWVFFQPPRFVLILTLLPVFKIPVLLSCDTLDSFEQHANLRADAIEVPLKLT